MEVLIRNRTIRPSQHDSDMIYKIPVSDAGINDLIIIFIDHESKDFREIYWTTGELTQGIEEISFQIDGATEDLKIVWGKPQFMTQML